MRWKERHQIHFAFGKMTNVAVEGGHNVRMREVNLELPLPYSHRMQIYAESESISVDLGRDHADGAEGYLIPSTDEGNEWLCITPCK